MGTVSHAYRMRHRLRLNVRAKISYHNRFVKIPYDEVHAYEKIHGIDATVLWLKMKRIEQLMPKNE